MYRDYDVLFYSHYTSAKNLGKSYLKFKDALSYVELILVKLIVSQISGLCQCLYDMETHISNLNAAHDFIWFQFYCRNINLFFATKIIF